MGVYLFANIGNSDLHLSTDLLPHTDVPGTVRQRGEYVHEHLDELIGHIQLPLLGPTLRWLHEQDSTSNDDLHVILFASDQKIDFTPDHERQKDTRPLAEAIRNLLSRADSAAVLGISGFSGLPKKRIRIHSIEGNPADYANMLAFYSQELPRLQQWIQDDDVVFLEISGGTPAMASMLVAVAVEVFGDRAHTLYVDRGAHQPYEVGVAAELYARRTRNALVEQIKLHAYAVAIHTLESNGTLITSDESQRALIGALLAYADRRLAFDFDQARSALIRARQLTVGDRQARIKYWLTQLEDPDISVNLAELLHSMRIKHNFGDYADFVQRIFRFQEASFRYMAEQMGIRYSKPKQGQYIDVTWVNETTGLRDFLAAYHAPAAEKPIAVEYAGQSLNRVSLGAIVDFFVTYDAQWHEWQHTALRLHALSKVAELRNRGLSGHGFRGIGRFHVEEAYGATIDELLEQLEEIYRMLFQRRVEDSPYAVLNEVLQQLIWSR